MKIRHAEADLLVRLESAGGRPHYDGGGFEGVVGREFEHAVENPAFVWCVVKYLALEYKVRVEEVGFERLHVGAWSWVFS